MDNRKDKEPVVGRLDEVDEAVEPLLGLRTDASRRFPEDAEGPGTAPKEPPGRTEPGEEPALSLAGGLTSRARAESRPEMSGTPGALLRDARERAQLDVPTLAQRTRLARKVIEDIEGNRFETIPPAYLRGYLRAAAKELGADGDLWIRAYESLGYSDPVVKPDAMSGGPGARSARAHSGLWYGLLAVLVITVLGLGIYAWEGREDPVVSVGAWLEDRGVFGWLERWTGRGPAVEPSPESPQRAPEAQPRTETLSAPVVVDLEFTSPAEPRLESADEHEPRVSGRASLDPELAVPPDVWVPVDPTATEEAPVANGVRDEVRVEAGSGQVDAGEAVAHSAAGENGSGPVAVAVAQPGVSTLRLSFQDTSWVEVRSSSEQVELRGVFHSGDDRIVSVGLPARIVLGNAQAVVLTRDGIPVDLAPHTQRDRTARFTLDAD